MDVARSSARTAFWPNRSRGYLAPLVIASLVVLLGHGPAAAEPPGQGPTALQSGPAELELGPMVIRLGPTPDGNWLLTREGPALLVSNLREPESLLWQVIRPRQAHREYRLSVTVRIEADPPSAPDLVAGAGLLFDATQDPFTFKLLMSGPDGGFILGRYDGDELVFPMSMSLGELRPSGSVRLAVELRGEEFRLFANGRHVSSLNAAGVRGSGLGIAATGGGRFLLADFSYEPL